MNPAPPDDTALALRDETVAMAQRVYGAIAAFDEEDGRYVLAGVPGIAFFQRDVHDDVIRHVSQSPPEEVWAVVDDICDEVTELRTGSAPGLGIARNSHLPALVMLCLYLSDVETRERFGLTSILKRGIEIVPLDAEAARHDPLLEPGDAALRIWTPLSLVGDEGALDDAHVAVLEARMRANRYERYAPW